MWVQRHRKNPSCRNTDRMYIFLARMIPVNTPCRWHCGTRTQDIISSKMVIPVATTPTKTKRIWVTAQNRRTRDSPERCDWPWLTMYTVRLSAAHTWWAHTSFIMSFCGCSSASSWVEDHVAWSDQQSHHCATLLLAIELRQNLLHWRKMAFAPKFDTRAGTVSSK